MAITKQDIWRIADELDAEGIRPTLAAVRKRLGRGSYTTISEAMAEWKHQKATTALPLTEPLPAAVNDQLAEFGASLWALALAQATARLEEDRRQIEAEKEAMQQRLAEATELADALTRENDELRERMKQLEAIEREHDKLTEQFANLKQRSAAELNRCMERVTQREAEAMEARKEARTATDRAAQLQGQVDALKEQLANLTRTIGGKSR